MSDNSTNKAIATIGSMSSGNAIMSTVRDDTLEGKKKTLAALTNAEPIADHLNETINLVHVVMQAVELTDEKTGEVTDNVRTILLAEDGKAYAGVSNGLVGSLRDVFGIMGEPATWPEALPVQVVEKRGNKGFRFYKIELV